MIVFVECYADAKVATLLGVSRRDIRHERGRGAVVIGVREADGPAIGLVDEDPQAMNVPSELTTHYAETHRSEGLRLLTHRRDLQKRIVVLCPRLEEWLLSRAERGGVDPSRYGLPSTARKLHGIQRYDRLAKFGDFIGALGADAGIAALRDWLRRA